MSSNKYKRTKLHTAAVLYADGAAAPANRPRYASYGAGVVTPGAAVVAVNVVSEGGGKTDQVPISLTRFAPGTAIPPTYRVITEATPDD